MGQMEEALAMLFQGRSLETKAQSDATHVPLLDQLAAQRFRPLPQRPTAQEQLQSWKGKRPGEEDDLSAYDRYDTATEPNLSPDRKAMAQSQASVNRVLPAGGALAYNRGMHGMNEPGGTPGGVTEAQGYAAYDARELPRWMSDPDYHSPNADPRNPYDGGAVTAGDHADTALSKFGVSAPEDLSSADERNIRGAFAKPEVHETYKGGVNPQGWVSDDPLDLVSDASMQRDDDVQQTGWLPSDFEGMSGQAAAALIADQLRTRRIRHMREAAPDYLQQLPKY